MLPRLLTLALLLLPLSAGAVYFPGGIDWTNPSQSRFVQSLYLNMLGRAPDVSETRSAVGTLRTNDNRTARLRVFESVLQSAEYQRIFNNTGSSWKVYQAPDYNYQNGDGYYRYQAAPSRPAGFTDIPGGGRTFTPSIATSVAHYYDAYCYRGDPCIDNPELARDKFANATTSTGNSTPYISNSSNAHACAEPSNLDSQFKWVAINGTTYPRGIGRDTICLEDSYFIANQPNLERYDCEAGYTNCKRNTRLDLRASRSGRDNDGHPSYFFRDGSRLALIETNQVSNNSTISSTASGNNGIIQPSDPLLADDAHACADPSQTTSRFTWQTSTRITESKGIGSNTVCMDNYYFSLRRTTLYRYNCDRGFINCQPDPNNNLTATSRTRVDGNPGLEFADGTTLVLSARNLASESRSRTTVANQPRPQERTQTRTGGIQPRTNNDTQQRAISGSDCADSKKRLSQFRWKSQGLSSWPDGIDGRIICLNNSYYEVTSSGMRNYACQSNYSNCTANPSKNLTIRQISQDGTTWTLDNGDELTLLSK